ncbi:hypothetical protein M124_4432 [Bacteroides fragilis str. 3988T(B)14]|uniref:Uncharacterized protein n=1 Tax=Bacteroides fragilis str. 3988T(B)14 TaxID=1339315 RepID=A0A015W896_BACFG|nr:hypothetical protein M124_4432 [Bacteroides fragilis str. 3988T(B)14]
MYEVSCLLLPALLYVPPDDGAKSMCMALCIYQIDDFRF